MLILGTRCDTEKALGFALQAIFGISVVSANKICAMIGVAPNVKIRALRSGRLDKLNKVCRDQVPTGLFRSKQEDIKTLINMKHYKGVRHMFALPCRGQCTRTNASTAKVLAVIRPKAKPKPLSRKKVSKR